MKENSRREHLYRFSPWFIRQVPAISLERLVFVGLVRQADGRPYLQHKRSFCGDRIRYRGGCK